MKARLNNLFVCALLVLCSTAQAAHFAGGTGEPNAPYQIATAEQLCAIGSDPNLLDKHFVLINDIDLDGMVFDQAVIAPDINESEPYFQGPPFSGVFDGDNHTIANLVIDSNCEYAGLFGMIQVNSYVKNLNLMNGYVRGAVEFRRCGAGSVAAENRGSVSNCQSNMTVIGTRHVGGIIGENHGILSNCSNLGQILGNSVVGGLVGYNEGTIIESVNQGLIQGGASSGGIAGFNGFGTVSNCWNESHIKGQACVGGLIGENRYGMIRHCYNAGSVEGSIGVGGLIGVQQEYQSTLLCCFNIGPVKGHFEVGGLIGSAYSGTCYDCYNTGQVIGKKEVGGLAGVIDDLTFARCYHSGTVTGESRVGALVGLGDDTVVFNCFWDLSTTDLNMNNGAGTGLSTDQRQDPNTFINAGWDFFGEPNNGTSEIWIMPEQGNFPELSVFHGVTPFLLAGEGTPEMPYLVQNAENLGMIRYYPNACYQLEANIDLAGISWSNSIIPFFSGQLDGNGHLIQNLTIHGASHVGLIGALGPKGSVTNLGLTDVNIVGTGDYVGSLAGINGFTNKISNCFCIGNITGASYVGGLVGENYGSILNSYARINVYGLNWIGGLMGINQADLINSYSTGLVTVSDFGVTNGMIGRNQGTVLSSFFDTDACGLLHPVDIGLPTIDMQTLDTYLNAGWDFEYTWILCEGDYPRLQWEQSPCDNQSEQPITSN